MCIVCPAIFKVVLGLLDWPAASHDYQHEAERSMIWFANNPQYEYVTWRSRWEWQGQPPPEEQTSRYNEWGDRRADFALADVFGANVSGETIGPHGNSYMRVERDHRILRGLEGTALLPGPENRVPVRAGSANAPVLTVVPYYPAFPPEMVFPRTPRTDQPAAIFREQGSSRVAYFAGDLEATSWRSGSADLSRVIPAPR